MLVWCFQNGGGQTGGDTGGSGVAGGQCTSTGSQCITASDASCRDLRDGDYQACEGCTFYHSCVNGAIIYRFRDCPATNLGGINGKLVWDDTQKRCEYSSNTYQQCRVSSTTVAKKDRIYFRNIIKYEKDFEKKQVEYENNANQFCPMLLLLLV